MPLVQVEGEDHPYEFEGELVASVTTETRDKPQWTEIELYRFTDDSGRYLVHIVGRSVQYHRRDSTCNAGVATALADLPEDAEPCPRCQPHVQRPQPAYLEFDDDDDGVMLVNLESDRHTAVPCSSPVEVLSSLRLPGRRGYSRPARDLLDQVREADPAFNALMGAVERL